MLLPCLRKFSKEKQSGFFTVAMGIALEQEPNLQHTGSLASHVMWERQRLKQCKVPQVKRPDPRHWQGKGTRLNVPAVP